MNEIEKLYKYLVKNHSQKCADISIWEYVDNPKKDTPYIKNGMHNSTFLNAKELEKQGLIEIQLHDRGDRAFLKVIKT